MKTSAGILLFKRDQGKILYFLVHPGGPFWKNKDIGAWSVPKGEVEEGENLLERAVIEFKEETGKRISGDFIPLQPVQQKSGKRVHAWALESDLELSDLHSNTLFIDWPPRSGKKMEIPEVDQWQWFEEWEAREKINPAQAGFINEIEALISTRE